MRVAMRPLQTADLAVEFIERGADLIEYLAAARRQAIHAGGGRTLWRRRLQPAAPGHAGQDWIQRARADVIAVFPQFLEHPVAVDTVLVGMMQDVHLPEGEQEFANDRVAHGLVAYIVAGLRVACQCEFWQQPASSCCGGHGVSAKEQNTQQSPALGRRIAPQPWQS